MHWNSKTIYDCKIQAGFSGEMLGDNGINEKNRSNFSASLLVLIN